jgi:hypothetical protein
VTTDRVATGARPGGHTHWTGNLDDRHSLATWTRPDGHTHWTGNLDERCPIAA